MQAEEFARAREFHSLLKLPLHEALKDGIVAAELGQLIHAASVNMR
jgi:hypothetical protein